MTERRPIPANIELQYGAHHDGENAYCAMELVAYVAGEPHSDHPVCTCPVICVYVRTLNDRMDDATRQRLLPFVELVIGTRATPDIELRRALIAADFALRDALPTALDAVGYPDDAITFRKLDPITGVGPARSAWSTVVMNPQSVASVICENASLLASAAARAAARTAEEETKSAMSAIISTASLAAVIASNAATRDATTVPVWTGALECLGRMIAVRQ